MSTPPLRLPSIDGLRAFEAAARLGTFERAADELAVTASAVAKRLAALEELLGTALFIRTGKALLPTAAGREYLPQVADVLARLAAVPLHQQAKQRLQRLKVSSPPTFARQVLVPALEHFARQHPAVELEVVLSVPYLDTGPGSGTDNADVVVRLGDPATPGASVLLHEQVHALAAPALLARLPPLHQPADLAGAPLLRTPIEPWLPWFRAAGLHWPEPDQGPRLVDLGLTLEAAAAGQGVVLARPLLARPWLEDGRLLPLFGLTATPASQYLVLQRHPPSDAALAFVAWLQAVVVAADLAAQQALALAVAACARPGGSAQQAPRG